MNRRISLQCLWGIRNCNLQCRYFVNSYASLLVVKHKFIVDSLPTENSYFAQVQLRFCALDSTTEQDDQFPPNLNVKVNAKVIPLPHPIPSNRPGVEPKRPSRPLNITNFVRLSPTVTNTITVTWSPDNSRGYALSLYLVKKLTAADLLARMKQKGPRPPDYTKGLSKSY